MLLMVRFINSLTYLNLEQVLNVVQEDVNAVTWGVFLGKEVV